MGVKKMKSIAKTLTSLLLLAALVLISVPALAGEITDGWEAFIDFEDWPEEEVPHIRTATPTNVIYSEEYLVSSVGSTEVPPISISTDENITPGGGKSLKIATKANASGKYTEAYVKFFNTFKDSNFTAEDIGRTFKVTFWAKAEKMTNQQSFYVGDAGSRGKSNHALNATKHYNNLANTETTGGFKCTPSALDVWEKYEFEYTLDHNNVDDEYQFGLFAIRMPGSFKTDEDGGGHIFYIDDISIKETDGITFNKTIGEAEEEIKELTQDNITAYATMYTGSDASKPTDATPILCLYDGDMLEKVSIGNTEEIVNIGTVTADMDLSQTSITNQHTLKMFVWDGLNAMMPIRSYGIMSASEFHQK